MQILSVIPILASG